MKIIKRFKFSICQIMLTLEIVPALFEMIIIIIIIIIKVLEKTHSTYKMSRYFLQLKKRALTKQVRFHSPFKTINTVALSNGKW